MHKHHYKGFTLIEVLVAVFLTTIVLSGVYAVWIRVTKEVTKSSARQDLQSQLRRSTESMKKDFSAIKEGSFKLPAGKQSADGTSICMEFERFTETEDGKIAQDTTEEVTYTLANGLLTRKSPTKVSILSTYVDSVQLSKGPAAGGMPVDNDLKSAREANLNIEILGKRNIRGSKNLMYHAERTTVVMRDEYYKKTNKTYKSNFDLAKLNKDDIVKEDSINIALFDPSASFSAEQLSALEKEQLEGMLKTQTDMLAQAKQSVKDTNEQIDGVDTGSPWWDWVPFTNTTDGEKVQDMRKQLVKDDTVEDIEKTIKELKGYAEDKGESFLKDSITGYESMDQEKKDLYQRAYDMKIQDRTLKGAYEFAKKDKPDTPPPLLMIENATKVEVTTWTDEDGVEQTTDKKSLEKLQEEADELQKAYDAVNIEWMGEFGADEEKDEVKAYNAAKALITQGEAKIEVVKMRENSKENKKLIEEAISNK